MGLKLNGLLLAGIIGLTQLQGCTTAVVGGAAMGGAVAVDDRTVGRFVEDENIELKFLNKYYKDKELRQRSHLNATSFNGYLLLTGEAPTESLRQRAEQYASSIQHVRKVFNQIILGAPSSMMTRSSDTVITTEVKSRLLANKTFGEGIRTKVVTENGVVYLMGIMTPEQGNKAAEIARNVSGVQRVVKVFEYQ